MIMRRAVLLLAALVVGGVMTAGAAGAQENGDTFGNDDDYTALCIPLVLSSTSVSPGDSITASGTAATGGAPIFIVLDNSVVLAQTTSDVNNHFFQASVTIPAGTSAGSHTIQAFQVGDDTDILVGCPASLATINVLGVTIVEQPPAVGPTLARTGADSTVPMTRIGVGLVAAGGLFVLAARRRRTALAAV